MLLIAYIILILGYNCVLGTGTLVIYAGGHLYDSGTPTRRVLHDSTQWVSYCIDMEAYVVTVDKE